MYLRAFYHGELWKPDEVKCVSDLSLLALSDFATKDDSELSVFYVDDDADEESINLAALRFFASNTDKAKKNNFCFSFLKFEDKTLESISKVKKDISIFETTHSNITDMTLSKMCKLIKCSFEEFKNPRNYIDFEMKSFKSIMLGLNDRHLLKKYITGWFGKEKATGFSTVMNKSLFRDKPLQFK